MFGLLGYCMGSASLRLIRGAIILATMATGIGATAAIAQSRDGGSPAPGVSKGLADKIELCAGCHGVDGKPADKTIPIIWGQLPGYIYIQLRDFKRGDRKNEIMQPIASALERDEMLAIGEFFSQKPWPDLGQPRAPKAVALKAIEAEHSVGCTGCHLDQFQGTGIMPRLAGQSREYLARTIAGFRTRERGNNPGMSDLMIATPQDDLAALAEYLAGL
jgi:cytochrome c553